MKQSEPNTLQRELARSQQPGPHPDPNLLTGFAEGTLLPREREAVMAHLATCAFCRDVLDIAASSAPEAAGGLRLVAQKKGTKARLWVPWLGIAATIAVVSSTVFVHQRRLAPKPGGDHIAVAKAVPEPSPAAVQEPPISMPAQLTPERKKVEPLPAMKAAVASPQVELEQLATVDRVERGNIPYPPNAKLQRMGQAPSGSSQTANETVSVASDASQIATEDANSISLAAQSETNAATKSTPSAHTAPAFAGAGGALGGPRVMARALVRPRWRINEKGQAERSVAESEWQPVLPNETARMRVVSVSGNHVWVGGGGLKLYHSTDNGATWAAVTLPNTDGLAHAIAHIQFTGLSGTITAEDGATWTSSDGGATWR